MTEKKKQAFIDLIFVSFNVSKKLLFYSLTFNNYLLYLFGHAQILMNFYEDLI